jgi:hypothetical protein
MMSVLPICCPRFYTGRAKHAKKIFFVKSNPHQAECLAGQNSTRVRLAERWFFWLALTFYPLPQERKQLTTVFNFQTMVQQTQTLAILVDGGTILLLPGEKAGMRAGIEPIGNPQFRHPQPSTPSHQQLNHCTPTR